MTFFLGCAVWAYKGWIGDFYPPGSRASDFLHLYSQRFTTVEGNTTFYVLPDQDTVARWQAETPFSFEFCLKLPRDLTHAGLLQPSIAGALSFLERMRGLQDRLGPVFAQLPPSYKPSMLDDLIAFLTAWPRSEVPLALEVRHLEWFQEPYASQLNSALKALGVGRVLLDSRPVYENQDDPQLHSERRKPQVPLQPELTADFCLVRFISHPNQEANHSFFQEWVPKINAWLEQGKRIYFFVHCPLEERSPSNARYFQQLLEQQGVPIPPLPWNQIAPAATQLSLF